MLILTRCLNEILCVGSDVEIEVLGIRGHQVRLGIRAPKSVPVHRKEVWLRIQAEKEVQS